MKLFLIGGIFLLMIESIFVASETDDKNGQKKQIAEPPFPRFYQGERVGTVLKIVSEVIDNSIGYQTNEEYIDVALGRAAHIVSNIKGQKIAFVDVKLPELTYLYWPYECKTLQFSEKVFANSDDYYMSLTLFKTQDMKKRLLGKMRLFGGLAIWALVQDLPKHYSQGTDIFSTSKNVIRPAHVWEAKFRNGNIVRLHFVDANYEPGDEDMESNDKKMQLTLEVIQILEVTKDGTQNVIRTFNMVSIDWVPIDERINNLLQIPVGYGCPGTPTTGNYLLDNYVHNHRTHQDHHMVELEVTETVLEAANAHGVRLNESIARTVNVQYFSTEIIPRDQHIEMLRIRDSIRDVKLVTYRHLSVKYFIDLMQGSCEILNMASPIDKMNLYETPLAGNGLELTPTMLRYLLEPPDGPEFIKESVPINAGALRHLYYERVLPWPMDLDKMNTNNWYSGSMAQASKESPEFARVIRNFAQLDEVNFVLESVTIWIFDQTKTRISQSYHISVLNGQDLDTFHQQARLLDLSEECYIESDSMKSGRDYAWIELFYPTSSRNNDLLAKDEWSLKERFYGSILSGDNFKLDVLRFPRIELMFGDEGFEVRMLMLDMPPIEKIYTETSGKALKSNQNLGDLALLSPDVKHCAQLCRVHNCRVFSYCEVTRECTLAATDSTSSTPTLEHGQNCQANRCYLYELPDSLTMEELHQSSLHSMLSKLQFHDYSAISLPKVPEELSLGLKESGLDEETRRRVYRDYQQELLKSLLNSNYQLNELVLIVHPADHAVVIMPNKFAIEDDPLDSFDLIDRETSDALQLGNSKGTYDNMLGSAHESEQIADYFRVGLPSSTYKFLSFPEALRDQSRRISSLTYDQCALACMDTKCGSFSYCPEYRECIITSLNSTRLGQEMDLVSKSASCFIAQRDFLRNFYQYSKVFRPQAYKSQLDTKTPSSTGARIQLTASDCALECVAETSFRCMSFQICHLETGSTCFFQADRHPKGIYGSIDSSEAPNAASAPVGCNHYERSYLADFNQVEYRQIDPNELAKLVTSTYRAKTSFQCADICANELQDCSGFQFCFQSPASLQETGANDQQPTQSSVISMQTCTMIQSKPSSPDEQSELSAIVDEKDSGQVLKSGKFIKPSESCHLFSLRATSSEAHLRDLALANVMTLEESKDKACEAERLNRERGLSLKACFILFLSVTSVSMALGFGVCLARERNEFIRQRLERGRLLLGF